VNLGFKVARTHNTSSLRRTSRSVWKFNVLPSDDNSASDMPRHLYGSRITTSCNLGSLIPEQRVHVRRAAVLLGAPQLMVRSNLRFWRDARSGLPERASLQELAQACLYDRFIQCLMFGQRGKVQKTFGRYTAQEPGCGTQDCS
jgi:hypothetical protein